MTTDKKILIVEDDHKLSQMLLDMFAAEGIGVMRASNGEEGLAIATEEHPDIILLDIILPKMDGITMLNKLREDEWGKSADVIMLTNLSTAEDVHKATEAGAYDYLIKSDWKMADVVKKVKDKLGMSE
ncbi:stage 0 sporulation protein A [bacterium BMS3Abin15]|nr:stage 0 sporulation protein A [bacterium BMS3Abin15]